MFRGLAVAVVLGSALGAGAAPLASHSTVEHSIVLMTEPCPGGDDGRRRAYRISTTERIEGCWSVNARGNPEIAWPGEPRVQEFDESLFRLDPRYAELLQHAPPPPAAAQPAPAEGSAFPRPDWCRNARQPHERLVCRDRELSAEDLKLGALWQAYRTEQKLGRAEQARHKNEFYRRLKACGADRDCVAAEQAARILFYREALGLE